MQLRAPNFCTVALGSLQLDVALFDINSTKRINEFTLTRNLLFLFYCVTHNSNQYICANIKLKKESEKKW